MPASADLARQIAEQTNHILAYRRKVIMMHADAVADVHAGAAGEVTRLYYAFHSGEGVSQVEANLILAPASASATTPYVYFDAKDDFATDTTTASDKLYPSQINTALVPDHMTFGRLTIDVIADTDYTGFVYTGDYARIMSCAIYEIGTTPVDSAAAGVDPNHPLGSQILDTDLQTLLQSQTKIHGHNAGPVVQWTGEKGLSSTSYVNIFDGTGGVSSATVGVKTNLAYHQTYDGTSVPMRMYVYAKSTGSSSANNGVRVTDGTNSVEMTTFGGSGQWYYADGSLPASDGVKLDIQAKANGGDTVTVYGVYLVEYEA